MKRYDDRVNLLGSIAGGVILGAWVYLKVTGVDVSDYVLALATLLVSPTLILKVVRRNGHDPASQRKPPEQDPGA